MDAKELRAAAMFVASKPTIANRYDNVSFKLAQAILAEHHADDDEPIDETWLRSAGFKTDNYSWAVKYFDKANEEGTRPYLCFEHDLSAAIGEGGFDSLGSNYIPLTKPIKTRGDVRRLCRALGIPLKESPEKTT